MSNTSSLRTSSRKKITAVIPCYNEETGVAAVIAGFPRKLMKRRGYDLHVLVVDNNSTDATTAVAARAGATVIHEPRKGKGNAIRTAFYNVPEDTDYVVMLDGDDTYKSSEVLRLIEMLDSGFCQVVVGSRLGGRMNKQAMPGFNRLGNWLFSFLVRAVYKVNVTDTLTGYFAWHHDVIVQLRQHLQSTGFAIEMEMITKMARLGYGIYSAPITYAPRLGESSLRPVHDGSRILREFTRQLRWRPRVERVAFVSDAIYPYNKGGKEKRLHELTKHLVRDGRQVDIYTMRWWDGPRTLVTADGVRLHAIGKRRALYAGERRSILQALWFSTACFKLLWRRFDMVDVDSMPFFPLFSMRLVCWLKRRPLYATWHEVWGASYWSQYLGMGGRVGALTEKLAMKMPSLVISNSRHTTKRLRAAGMKRPIVTVPLGVDVDNILALPAHQLHSDAIFVGRLLPNKNVDMLLRAVANLKESRPGVLCVIVGDGPERPALEVLAKELGLDANITFLHFLEDHNELYSLMKSSKMLVQPSTREGFGLVVVEANACGLPVVTTAHQDNAAGDLIVEGENGWLAQPNPVSLAQRMQAVLDNDLSMQPLAILHQKFGAYRWPVAARAVEEAFQLRPSPAGGLYEPAED